MVQMSHTVFRYAKKVDWHSLLMGGLIIIFAFVMVFHLGDQVKQFSIIMGLVAILKGFLNFNYYSILRGLPDKTLHSLFLVSGIMSVLFGLFIIFSFSATNNLLCVICGFWFIWDYIPQIFLNELKFVNHHRLLILFRAIEILSIICGVVLMLQSFMTFINPMIFAIIYYFLSGGSLLWENYRLSKKRS